MVKLQLYKTMITGILYYDKKNHSRNSNAYYGRNCIINKVTVNGERL